MNFHPPTKIFKVNRFEAASLAFTAALTAAVLFGGNGRSSRLIRLLYEDKSNEVRDALGYMGLCAVVAAMLLGLLVVILAGNIRDAKERSECAAKLKAERALCVTHDVRCSPDRLCFVRDFPDGYPADEPMSSKGSVWAYFYLLEFAICRVGEFVTSVACGAALYLCYVSDLSWWLFAGTVVCLYLVAIFPNFIRWRVLEELSLAYNPIWYKTWSTKA